MKPTVSALGIPAQAGPSAKPPAGLSPADFGHNFRFGVATSAYQIEGAWNEHGRCPSIWDTFVRQPGRISDGSTGDEACGFYHHYKQDIALARSLGFTVFRMSLSWSRILPQGIGRVNPAGIEFYRNVFAEIRANGMEPWVTLYHWDLPQALQDKGGWTNRAILDWFAQYVDTCAWAFGGMVNHWMVLNEPFVIASLGHLLGTHAPGIRNLNAFLRATHHLALAQAEGGRILRRACPHARIGTTFSCAPTDPYRPHHNGDQGAARRMDALMNRLFVEPAAGLGYPIDGFPVLRYLRRCMKPGDEARMAFEFDFWGVQNYSRYVFRHRWWPPFLHAKEVPPVMRGVAPAQTTEMNWEVYPEGIYRMLRQFGSYANAPELVVTESGAAFPDTLQRNGSIQDTARTSYLQAHLVQVRQAQLDGVRVGGFFAWSLLDNFEWAEGYRPRFGLVHVDYTTQRRTIKQSGHWFRQWLITDRGIATSAKQAATRADA